MKRSIALIIGVLFFASTLSLLIPSVRNGVQRIVRPEPPPPITPLAVGAISTISPRTAHTSATTIPPTSSPQITTSEPSTVTALLPTPLSSPTLEPVIVNGRVYDAYVSAVTTKKQVYQYSCEFDAAWVILQTYGIDVTVDDLIAAIPKDDRVEPSIGEETADGWIIYGGDIFSAYSGDYTTNFLARTTGTTMQGVFEQYGVVVTPVNDRAGVEAALRAGALVWMKTTVDFKPWRPAIWKTPDGRTHKTVLGNDHALVVIGFNADVVVIRDVLGPTSSNWERPYEYEVDWGTFLKVWEAQSFDGLAVVPPPQ